MAVNNSNILSALMNTYDGAADTVERLIDELTGKEQGAGSEKKNTLVSEVTTAKGVYKFNQNITDYDAALPKAATGIQIKKQDDVTLDLTSPYIQTTVDESGLSLSKTAITLGKESGLQKVNVADINKGLLDSYNKNLYDVLVDLANELDNIEIDTITFDYVERPESFYTALYTSGFLALLKDFDIVDNIEESCARLNITIPSFCDFPNRAASTFDALVDGLAEGVSQYIDCKLNKLGFRVPTALISTTDVYLGTIRQYTKEDYQNSLSVMLEKLKAQAMNNVLSISQLEEEFTKHINNAEVILHKTLLAAKAAQVQGEISVLTTSLKGHGQKIKAVADYFKYIDQAINVYKLNMQSASSLSQAWSSWVDAVVSKEKIALEFNQLYLDEFKGLLKEKAEADKYKKMLLDNYTKLAELNSDKLVAEKKLELEKNTAELMIYAAKLDFAKRHLKQFGVELDAFANEINSIYEKYKVTADLIPAYADISVAGAKGLASVIGDSKIKLTTYKK